MGKSTPDAPDPRIAIEAQSAANLEAAQQQAQLNRIDEITPLGSTRFGENFDQVAFDAAQSQFDQAQAGGKLGALGGALGGGPDAPDPFDFTNFSRTTTLNPTAQATFEAQQNLGLDLANLAHFFPWSLSPNHLHSLCNIP